MDDLVDLANSPELLHVRFLVTPRGADCVLHALDSPEEVEYAQVSCVGLVGEDCLEWAVHAVVQGKDVPANIVRRALDVDRRIVTVKQIWLLVRGFSYG